VQIGDEPLPRMAPVTVSSVSISGHEPIVIKSYTPQEVKVLVGDWKTPDKTEKKKAALQ
jgi:hypothetical protein